ncbi:MAG: hypothetical protein M3209_20455 [Acidobacteriota bacterium]|nr:hypothetical protein [Acidobacteriota bacterium]
MPESIRFFTSRLSESAQKLFSAPRKKAHLPITVSLEIGNAAGRLNNPHQKLNVAGFTQDFSKDDVNFILPMIRLGEHYLAGSEQKLILEIELPERKVRMKATASCYELIGMHDSVNQYLIGAKITEMNAAEREYLENFIKYGEQRENDQASVFDSQPKPRKASLLGQLFNL